MKKEFRVGPSRNGELVASPWKFQISGTEIYAISRFLGRETHISMHESGQIHLRLGHKHAHPLNPIYKISGTSWSHAIDLQYLLSNDALVPTQGKNKTGDKVLQINVADGETLKLRLLIGRANSPLELLQPIPENWRLLWSSITRDDRPVVLVALVRPMKEDDLGNLHSIRHEQGLRLTFDSDPGEGYFEVMRTGQYADGRNVLRIVPMGKEAIHVLGMHAANEQAPRVLRFTVPEVAMPLHAPDHAYIGQIKFAQSITDLQLVKDQRLRAEISTVELSLQATGLQFGNGIQFKTPPVVAKWNVSMDGVHHTWLITYHAIFDGAVLRVEISPASIGFRNAVLTEHMPRLSDDEMVVAHAPFEPLALVATREHPTTSSPLIGGFALVSHSATLAGAVKQALSNARN